MTYFKYALLLSISMLVSCRYEEEYPDEKINEGKIITQPGIKERMSRLDLVNEQIEDLSLRPDTLELSYYFGSCDCQRWIPSALYQKALTNIPQLELPDFRGQTAFSLDKHGYYIEPAHDDLGIDWRAEVNGTTIRFIGRKYLTRRLPAKGEFTVPDPPEGKVLRYYSYEILRPYRLWGPQKVKEIDKEIGDTIFEPAILTVE